MAGYCAKNHENGLPRMKRFLIIGIALMLTACGPTDSSNEKQQLPSAQSKKMSEQAELLTKPNRDNSDFVRQLRAQVKAVDGLLVVEDQLLPELSVLPLNSPWVVNCGIGLSVAFGTAVSGSTGDVSNDAKVTLTLLPIAKERCKELAPIIAKDLQLILNGR
jgi:hypothetical protein